jgi:hypothetical protein
MALDKFELPPTVISQGDVSRLKRELEAVDNFIKQASLRQPGTPLKRLPKESSNLTDFVEINKLNLLIDKDRNEAIEFTDELFNKAPVVHISFAADPSAAFINKITNWFRQNIDHLILVNVGLEPSIAVGCTVRTDNRFHDFSLRKHFESQRSLLLSKLKQSS